MPEPQYNLKAPNMQMHNNEPIANWCLVVVFLVMLSAIACGEGYWLVGAGLFLLGYCASLLLPKHPYIIPSEIARIRRSLKRKKKKKS